MTSEIALELEELRAELARVSAVLPKRIDIDPEDVERSLAGLVLGLVELLREVLERQAVRRMEGGTLSDDEIERVGLALMRLERKVRELADEFGLKDSDQAAARGDVVTIDHRRLSATQSATLVDLLDRVLDKGLVVAGDVSISLANVELLTIRVRLLVCSIDKAEQIGLNWWRNEQRLVGEDGELKRLRARVAELEQQLKRSGEKGR